MDYEKALKAFKNFVKNYNQSHDKISLKTKHTYEVVKISEDIAKSLKLNDEDIYLAKITALLHDIGRFDQVKFFDNFNDFMTIDHADYGVKLLFDDGLIKDFAVDEKYHEIIFQAIKNHNKYAIDDSLTKQQLLHSKIIRDADKTDIFRVLTDNSKIWTDNVMSENETISDEILTYIMNSKPVDRRKRQTKIDNQLSYIGFVFDYNFNFGLRYIQSKDYANKIINKFNYKNPDTKQKMALVKKHINSYINDRLKNI